MWNYWLKIEYSSDEETIPKWKQWAKMSDELRYDNEKTYVINLNSVQSVDLLTEENKKHVLGTLAGAGVGLALLGPLGAAVGLLTGGNKKEVNIAVNLKDGRHFIARCTNKTYATLIPYASKNKDPLEVDTKECPMCAETIKEKARVCRFCSYEFKQQ